MKLFSYPKLGAQYTLHKHSGKSTWSHIRSYQYTTNETSSNFTTIISGLSKVVCMAFDGSNNLYVTCDGTPNQLLKYNSSYEMQPFVSNSAWVGGNVGTLPVAMAFNQDFSALYVVNFASNNLTRINMSDFSYVQVTLTGVSGGTGIGYRLQAPNGLTFDTTYSYLIATNIRDSNLVQIFLDSSGTSGTIGPFCPSAPLTQPILVTVDANDNFFVSNFNTNQIFMINQNGYSVFATCPLPRGVSFNVNYYNYLWVTTSESIVRINVSNTSNKQSYSDVLFNNPRGILFDADNYMYVSNFGNGANTSSILRSKNPISFL